jgi:predicted nucleic acid-binding protein
VIIVDCSTVAHLLLPCEHTAAVEALLVREPVWGSVTLWEAELASVLLKHERHRQLDPWKSLQLVDAAMDLLRHTTFSVPMHRALEVARRSGCSSYDSYYVALAEELGCKLFTYDKEVLLKCPHVALAP